MLDMVKKLNNAVLSFASQLNISILGAVIIAVLICVSLIIMNVLLNIINLVIISVIIISKNQYYRLGESFSQGSMNAKIA